MHPERGWKFNTSNVYKDSQKKKHIKEIRKEKNEENLF